ncbi:hypothetical protein ANCCAN_18396 [Ancylostoma caninum]|uniref:Uncharacterized protein n=1 Tax=Ancylostoma caninum TaxID=29170 RepID=A0A368FY93_ANCCA|nr:hypothetical protein ANCCAN_18396 [Ancylostoma caninum]
MPRSKILSNSWYVYLNASIKVTLCSAALGLFRAHKEEGELVAAQGRLVFYKCLLKYLSHVGKETNFVMPIRFLETFTDSRDCVYLAKLNYFNCMLDLVAKLAPDRDKGEALVMEARLSPRLESLCQQLMLPIMRTTGKERIWIIRYLIRSICTNKHSPTMVSLVIPYYCRSIEESRISVRDTLDAFGTNPSVDTVPTGLTSTYFLALLLRVCEHCVGAVFNFYERLVKTTAGLFGDLFFLNSSQIISFFADLFNLSLIYYKYLFFLFPLHLLVHFLACLCQA